MRAVDRNVQTGLSDANDQVTFTLMGGRYYIEAVATWGGGSLTLETLGPDNSTWLTVGTAISANGVQIVEVPPGSYRWTIVTATAVSVSITRIPAE